MHYFQILTDIGGPLPLLITGLIVIAGALCFLAVSAARRRHDCEQVTPRGGPGAPFLLDYRLGEPAAPGLLRGRV